MEHAKWPCAHPLDYGEKKRLRRYIFMFMIYIYIFTYIHIQTQVLHSNVHLQRPRCALSLSEKCAGVIRHLNIADFAKTSGFTAPSREPVT